ncbi:RNA polymerase sigma factor [Microbacterium hominis]|uniref:Sigma-70 family RNA polymerase sigma factor n=1 Tax=Microbacterium hominis TaxID=162426 RepID=A0A7D4TRG2_9MICO|nr:sigma-70 family RNA polymerase sigma factor [Microbacterium hominis]QKJ19924.1 sigma-70 family RNA polymerase sigma factor [Microbacterium hominis]
MTFPTESFPEFYRANRRTVWKFVRRRVDSDDACEDICADVFELAYRKLDVSHPNPVGWLILTATHMLRAVARRKQRENQVLHNHAMMQAMVEWEDPRLEQLAEAWRRLPQRHQHVLQLLIWDQLPAADAAIVLRCSEQTVWKRASRARQALRDAWPTDTDDTGTEGGRSWDMIPMP